RERHGAAGDVGLRLESETAEPADRRGPLRGPAQRIAQGAGVGAERSLHLQRGPMADIAVIGELYERAREAELEPRALTGERGDEIGEAERCVDRLIMPTEAAGGREALRDRWPGQRELDISERFDDLAGVVAHDHGAVRDSDLGERLHPVGAWLQGA